MLGFKGQIIGITGSVGKTTTKEMVASILSQKYNIRKSSGNLDPVYNIPKTILSADSKTTCLVLEMGVEYPGEMNYYLWFVRPTIGVVTSINYAHTEFFKDIGGVANEKVKLLGSLPQDGWAVLNGDDPFVRPLGSRTKARVFWYGRTSSVFPIRATNIHVSLSGTEATIHIPGNEFKVIIPAIGEQFVSCALAATAVGYLLGISPKFIKVGIESFSQQPHRMQLRQTTHGATLIDDTYNASPLAMEAALDAFGKAGGKNKKIIILGDMLELGKQEKQLHEKVGEKIPVLNPEFLVTIGKRAHWIGESAVRSGLPTKKLVLFDTVNKAIPFLREKLKKDQVWLLKASHAVGLDKVVETLIT